MDFKTASFQELDEHISKDRIKHTEARDRAIVINEGLSSREVDGLLSMLKRHRRNR